MLAAADRGLAHAPFAGATPVDSEYDFHAHVTASVSYTPPLVPPSPPPPVPPPASPLAARACAPTEAPHGKGQTAIAPPAAPAPAGCGQGVPGSRIHSMSGSAWTSQNNMVPAAPGRNTSQYMPYG